MHIIYVSVMQPIGPFSLNEPWVPMTDRKLMNVLQPSSLLFPWKNCIMDFPQNRRHLLYS